LTLLYVSVVAPSAKFPGSGFPNEFVAIRKACCDLGLRPANVDQQCVARSFDESVSLDQQDVRGPVTALAAVGISRKRRKRLVAGE